MAEESPANSAPFTRKERIQELADIEKDITSSLLSAGKAIQALTGQVPTDPPPPDGQPGSQQLSPEDARQAFEQHTTAYMSHVQAISARLKRQIYALEEAAIIPATAKDEETQQSSVPQRAAPSANGLAVTAPTREQTNAPITNGGLGKFDIGWLNSRRDDVGKQKEAELWAEARAHLERVQQSKTGDAMQIESD
ncbi:hypothetical protein FH972_025529 [Carpinus fangiana]|uniref:Mediator of RNA polymerase II transcription subunit 11 n=1 Tax=Carpinus fangiana TaxID=176857 RepID=A0A5N6L2A9_9ROSI|nr:hypothetical protein FH972_025529 [Carpinus fangiana]